MKDWTACSLCPTTGHGGTDRLRWINGLAADGELHCVLIKAACSEFFRLARLFGDHG
jgi:hypothetical protein